MIPNHRVVIVYMQRSSLDAITCKSDLLLTARTYAMAQIMKENCFLSRSPIECRRTNYHLTSDSGGVLHASAA